MGHPIESPDRRAHDRPLRHSGRRGGPRLQRDWESGRFGSLLLGHSCLAVLVVQVASQRAKYIFGGN